MCSGINPHLLCDPHSPFTSQAELLPADPEGQPLLSPAVPKQHLPEL